MASINLDELITMLKTLQTKPTTAAAAKSTAARSTVKSTAASPATVHYHYHKEDYSSSSASESDSGSDSDDDDDAGYCKATLKSGKNKGKLCSNKIKPGNRSYCGRHGN